MFKGSGHPCIDVYIHTVVNSGLMDSLREEFNRDFAHCLNVMYRGASGTSYDGYAGALWPACGGTT